MNGTPWTKKELDMVRDLYAEISTQLIAERLGRSSTMVYQAANKLGLHKSAEYMASPAACRLRRGDNVGAAFRYKPGQVPLNKGLRRPGPEGDGQHHHAAGSRETKAEGDQCQRTQ